MDAKILIMRDHPEARVLYVEEHEFYVLLGQNGHTDHGICFYPADQKVGVRESSNTCGAFIEERCHFASTITVPTTLATYLVECYWLSMNHVDAMEKWRLEVLPSLEGDPEAFATAPRVPTKLTALFVREQEFVQHLRKLLATPGSLQ